MTIQKRNLITCACLLLAASVFAGCGSEANTPKETGNSSMTETAAPDESETEEPGYQPPTDDFGKEEFRIIATDDIAKAQQNAYHEELDGEPINDAIHQRDAEVEERLNIKLNYALYDNLNDNYMRTLVEHSVQAGDDEYDLVIGSPWFLVMRTEYREVYYDLCEIPGLSLTESWWSPAAYDNLRIKGKFYFTVCPISPMYYAIPCCMYFDKKLAAAYDIGDPYSWVKDGTWTFDKLFSITDTFGRDLNGDGEITFGDDLYGLAGSDYRTLNVSCGIKQIISHEDSYENNLNNEKMVKISEMFGDRFSDETRYWVQSPSKGIKNGNLLFAMITLQYGWGLRKMDNDYGILPLPKYDEEQEEYRNGVSSMPAAGVCVPTTITHVERNGTIMENLAFYSEKYIRPATHDVTILGKIAQDENTVEMLELIYDTMDYDFNEFYNVGNSLVFFSGTLIEKGEYMSKYAKMEKGLKNTLEKLLG